MHKIYSWFKVSRIKVVKLYTADVIRCVQQHIINFEENRLTPYSNSNVVEEQT
jgi:hypothetical protein